MYLLCILNDTLASKFLTLYIHFNLMYFKICVYVGFKTLFYVVRHLDSITSCLPTGLHYVSFVHGLHYTFHPALFRSSSCSLLLFVKALNSLDT